MIIAVIGGGAAGFFAALKAQREFPEATLIIYERSSKLLSKVKISGGGRCNVTNATFDNRQLARNYPRGENYLRKAFEQFNARSAMEWFESRGVQLRVYPDNCVFPLTNSSQTIIDCFLREADELGVQLVLNSPVRGMDVHRDRFDLLINDSIITADRVIVTIGGQPKASGLTWLTNTGHSFIEPKPSLFTFNLPADPIRELMGNVVERVRVKIEGTNLVASGPLLITHWGMSGPAVLVLSSRGARILADKEYHFRVLVNWLDEMNENELRSTLNRIIQENGNKMLLNWNPFPMSNRLWEHLLLRSSISTQIRWKEIGKHQLNRLVNTLLNDAYQVEGKTTFKEEFVTAGGINLTEVDFKTMQSKRVPGLFFAGEVLDIDGITGGFNFQAAWTTAFIAGTHVGE